MRIISGEFKGRRLTAKLPVGIRPTQDAMRETIFNVLANYFAYTGLCVADVCAGAGMLGIEALSRGADFVYFVDKNYKAIEHIKSSLQLLNVPAGKFITNNLDALQFINHIYHAQTTGAAVSKKIDLLFLDPPYNTNIVNEVLLQAGEFNIMSPDGIIVAETAIHNNLLLDNSFELLSERQFGAAKVYFIGNSSR